MKQLLAALVLAALTVACAEQATAPQDQAPAVAANFTNNPDVGPWIARGEGPVWIAWATPDGIRAIHASYDIPNTPGCGPDPSAYFPVDYQAINSRGDFTDLTTRIIERDMGTVWIMIVDNNQPGTCRNGWKLLAEGLGRYTYTDNDVFRPAGDRNNANAFSHRAEGQLTTPEGSKVHYRGAIWGAWKPDGTLDHFRVAVNLN